MLVIIIMLKQGLSFLPVETRLDFRLIYYCKKVKIQSMTEVHESEEINFDEVVLILNRNKFRKIYIQILLLYMFALMKNSNEMQRYFKSFLNFLLRRLSSLNLAKFIMWNNLTKHFRTRDLRIYSNK